jgi:hypothetical protein
MPNGTNNLFVEAESHTSRKTAENKKKSCPPPVVESHTHEFLGSTRLAEEGNDRHNHRFAGVTTGEIPIPGSHVHGFQVNTDSIGHFHEVSGTTGPAIFLNPQAPETFSRHVHLAIGNSTEVDDHIHVFIFATLIESPLA